MSTVIKVDVTQDDLKERNPVLHAFKRAIGTDDAGWWGDWRLQWYKDGILYNYGLPLEAVRWIVNTARGVEPRPFSFEINLIAKDN